VVTKQGGKATRKRGGLGNVFTARGVEEGKVPGIGNRSGDVKGENEEVKNRTEA